MNKTLSFMGLDFSLIRPYVKSILFMLGLGVAMGGGLKSTTTLSSFFMFSLILIMSFPFAVGDKNGLDILYSTLPINRRNVVVGRYLFVLTLEVVFFALALLCSWLLSMVLGVEYILASELFTLCLLSGAFSLVVAIQYPIQFKFGYNKAKIGGLIPLFMVYLVIILLPTLSKVFGFDFSWDGVLVKLMENVTLLCVASVLAGLMLLAVSCRVSCGIYAKRDI